MTLKRISGNALPAVIIGKDNKQNPSLTDHDGYLVIDVVHFNVHKGIVYVTEYTTESLADNGNHDIRFVTGPNPVHTTISIEAGGKCFVSVYEGATASGGTPLSQINQRRSSSSVSESSAFGGPTFSPSGTVIVNNRLLAGGSSPQTRVGGSIRQGTEIILKASTTYVIRVTNKSGAAVPVWVGIQYYSNTIIQSDFS